MRRRINDARSHGARRVAWWMAAALAVAVPLLVTAHEGEDHGAAAPAAQASAASSGVVTIPKEQQFVLGMITEPASRRELGGALRLVGRVVPSTGAIADVVPPVPGRVTGGALPRLGDRVRKGQVLFRVEQVVTPSERTSLRMEQIRARSELAAAEREVSRLERLEGVVAGKQLTDARIRRDAARDAFDALTARLSGRSGSVAVVAPISGEIVTAEVAGGEVLDGSRAVYRIADLSDIRVEASAFERDLAALAPGARALIRTPSYPDESFAGVLRTIGGEVDPQTRSIAALFAVPNPGGKLKLNMSASVEIATGASASVLAVPTSAIIESGARRVVFVHTAPETFELRDVTLGSRSGGGYVEITSGIRAGDRVLVGGTHQLRSVAGL